MSDDITIVVAPPKSVTILRNPATSRVITRSSAGSRTLSRAVTSSTTVQIAPKTSTLISVTPKPSIAIETNEEPPSVPITTAATRGPKGDPGAQGPPGPAASSTLTAIAAIDISGERIVISQADGTLIYDDPTNLALSEAAAFITVSAGIAGSEISLITYGPVSASFWNWTPGAPIFLGPNGTLTQSVPALPNAVFLLQVGVAETPTMIFWDPQPSIVLA